MSSPLFKADILFSQRLLASCGLYKDKLDGKYGKNTQAAEDAFDALYAKYAAVYGSFDPRSEGIIWTLLPKAQIAARKFLNIAKTAPFTVKLLSGTRTYAEQTALYNQGRTTKGPVVTKARAGQSNHNFGIAWDVGIFVGGVYYTGRNSKEDKAYADLANLVLPKMPEIAWGGNWKSIKDMPHYELATGKSVSQVRALLETGKSYA